MVSVAYSTVAHGTHDRPIPNVSIPAISSPPRLACPLAPRTCADGNPPPFPLRRHVFPALTFVQVTYSAAFLSSCVVRRGTVYRMRLSGVAMSAALLRETRWGAHPPLMCASCLVAVVSHETVQRVSFSHRSMWVPRDFFSVVLAQVGRSAAEAMAGAATACSFSLQCACSLAYQVLPTAKCNVQPLSQKSRTPTVAKEFQIGLCGVVAGS